MRQHRIDSEGYHWYECSICHGFKEAFLFTPAQIEKGGNGACRKCQGEVNLGRYKRKPTQAQLPSMAGLV